MVKAIDPVIGQQPTSPTPVKMGRPSMYSAELAAELCDYLAQGISLRSACKKKGMPTVKAVFLWLSTSNKELWREDFLQQYTRAKQESADMMAEEILDISDEKLKPTDDPKLLNARMQRARLRIDTRKFLMAKMKPKVYGDKMDLTSDGDKIEVGRGLSIVEINAILERAEQERKDAEKDQQG